MPRPEAAQLVRRLILSIVEVCAWPLRSRARAFLRAALAEDLVPVWTTETRHGPIRFHCPGRWPYSRSDMEKEPETYDWLETFDAGDVLWDIGANVGVYSLYAAARGQTAYAFEPEATTFAVLARNVDINGFGERITALNVAIGEKSGLGTFELAHETVGSAQHQLMSDAPAGGGARQSGKPRRTIFVVSGADLPDIGVQPPNHIKVDVDGSELAVVKGLGGILASPTLKSLQIELRANDDGRDIAEILHRHGFRANLTLDDFFGSATIGDVRFHRDTGAA